MKKTIFLIFLLSQSYVLDASRKVINKIVARVNGVNILKSHLEQQHIGIDPTKYSLEEAVDQELLFQEAVDKKLIPSEGDVEKQIASVRGKMDDDEFEVALSEQGFNLKRYRSELTKAISIAQLLSLVVKEKVFVSSEAIERYAQKNPAHEEEKFLLKTTIVSFEEAPDEKALEEITEYNWVESDWISKRDVSKDFHFVFDMKKGEISRPMKTEHGFQLVMLVDREEKRLKSIEERRTEIENKLRQSQMNKLEKSFKAELRKKASIVYL